MTGLGPSSGGNRPFWLLVALAVTLLMSVSTTVAHAAAPDPATALGRDLAALQAQIEWLDRRPQVSVGAAPGFNAELGDGSVDFLWQATGRMMRSVRRRIDHLERRYGSQSDTSGSMRGLVLELYQLEQRLRELRAAADGESALMARTAALEGTSRMTELLARLAAAGADDAPGVVFGSAVSGSEAGADLVDLPSTSSGTPAAPLVLRGRTL